VNGVCVKEVGRANEKEKLLESNEILVKIVENR
jgi:hypothetical protein